MSDAGRLVDRLEAIRIKHSEPVKLLPQRWREALDLARSLRLVDMDFDSVALPQQEDFVPGTIAEKDGEPKALYVDMLEYFFKHERVDSSEFGMPLT